MQPNKKRFSRYIRPLAYLIDVTIINVLSCYFLTQGFVFHLFITLAWIGIAIGSSFYEVYRFTKLFNIFLKIVKQYFLFLLANFLYFGLSNEVYGRINIIFYVSAAFFIVLLFKLFIYYFLKYFRINYAGNYRNVLVIGDKTEKLVSFFEENPDYGYIVSGRFKSDEIRHDNFDHFFKFSKENKINEIYISVSSFTDKEVNRIVSFADNNLMKIKLLIDRKNFFARNLTTDFYGDIPVVSLRNFPLDDVNNRIIKRTFDILFSSFVILFILSWLTPILAILIKIESNGSVFFKQKRNGINFKEFMCFKYRSMQVNNTSDTEQVTKGDARVTKIGGFLRKTSLDELPQFINVLLGDMSVVGPRPHMVNQSQEFAKTIDKFTVRHFVKPGITGLAQISGCRGEVETRQDIIKRVRYDIYYSVNWSILFDVKIIFKTVVNAISGEEKAY